MLQALETRRLRIDMQAMNTAAWATLAKVRSYLGDDSAPDSDRRLLSSR